MKLHKAALLVCLMTMGFQMWSWIAGWLIAAAIQVATHVAQRMKERSDAESQKAFDESAQGMHSKMSGQYRRSAYMPDEENDPMARYAPENRQPQSTSPLMSYLQRFTQSRY